MGLYSYFRVSKPAPERVPQAQEQQLYRRLRRRTFWGATAAYSLYYVCRMAFSVVKQPLIDEGVFSAAQLGVIGSVMLLVYAFGKFANGFIADYCNVRRFMSWGLFLSAAVNLVMGVLGWLGSAAGFSTSLLFFAFAILWGLNGWAQSMGAPPAVISLSRWFPLRERGTFYSILCATPYLGKALTLVAVGMMVGVAGWQWGFLFAAVAGLAGAAVIVLYVHDTPESEGLPPVQELVGEKMSEADRRPTRSLQKAVFRHPGIWVIALSSAFVYITQYGISNWGVLFLQKAKNFPLAQAAQVIGVAEFIGVLGTVLAGWLSDRVFRGNRVRPVVLSGLLCLGALCGFLFTGGGFVLNVIYVAVFALFIGVLYCIVSGLMALDIVPRKATGAALGIVGVSSYVAAALQDVVSGLLIQGSADGAGAYDWLAVAVFWLGACLVSFLLPVIGWKTLYKKVSA